MSSWIDEDSVLAERKNRFPAFLLNDLRHGKIVFFRKGVIAFVVRRDGHYRAGAVGIKHVVGEIYGQFFTREGMRDVSARKSARLFARRGKSVDIVGRGRIRYVGVDVGGAFGMRFLQFFDERMLGGKDDVIDAEKRIGTGGESSNVIARFTLDIYHAAR